MYNYIQGKVILAFANIPVVQISI